MIISKLKLINKILDKVGIHNRPTSYYLTKRELKTILMYLDITSKEKK